MNTDLVRLAHAADYAARQHIAQRRKGPRGEPYVNHLTEVASLLAEATDGSDVVLLMAGLLHDTLEDTDTTYEDLVERFGSDVAALVAEVTDDKSLTKEERKRRQIEKTSAKSHRAKLLKIADKTSNLRSLVQSPPAGWTEARQRDYGLAQDPLKSLIVPRPIGWISTIDRRGRVNLAPYSFYNAVSEHPPMVYFSITGTYGSTPTKHSRMNAESTGEFVVNMVSEKLKEQMNVTTTMVEFGVDELKLAGLTAEPSTLVKPPRVKESPVALECRYWRTIELPVEKGHETKRGSVVFGQVVGVHIDDSIIKDGRIDTLAFKPVARLGYSEYTTTDNVWRMRRPDDPKYQ